MTKHLAEHMNVDESGRSAPKKKKKADSESEEEEEVSEDDSE